MSFCQNQADLKFRVKLLWGLVPSSVASKLSAVRVLLWEPGVFEVFFRESQSPFRLVGLVNPFSNLIETANPSLLSNYHLIFFRLLETKEITK